MYIKQNSLLSLQTVSIASYASSFLHSMNAESDPLTSYQKHCTHATGVNITERTWPLALPDFYLIDVSIWQLYAELIQNSCSIITQWVMIVSWNQHSSSKKIMQSTTCINHLEEQNCSCFLHHHVKKLHCLCLTIQYL